MSRDVYIIGAGFSAGLEFPISNKLLEFIWPAIPKNKRKMAEKVIQFHNHNFLPNHPHTFPDVEVLLTQLDTNIELFNHTRRSEGNFKKTDLIAAKNELLVAMAREFHSTHKTVFDNLENYSWLEKFRDHYVKSENSTIISFNYDLILEELLFKDAPSPNHYGFGKQKSKPQILKPHGSLNWFSESSSKGRLKEDRVKRLSPKDDVGVFAYFRQPNSKRKYDYIPHIVPPTFMKKFDGYVFKNTFQKAVSALSKAEKVYFLGYSLPKADFHSNFMLRCGLYNQVHGEITKEGKRTDPVGPAEIKIVNPSIEAVNNVVKIITDKHSYSWEQKNIMQWIEEASTP